jgi:hypothetical protein
MAVQQGLEVVDLVLRDGALGQQTTSTLSDSWRAATSTRSNRSRSSPFGRGELEESVRVLGLPQHRARPGESRMPARCSGQGRQQQGGVLGAKIGTAMAGRDLVPAGVDAGALHAGIARERQSSPSAA